MDDVPIMGWPHEVEQWLSSRGVRLEAARLDPVAVFSENSFTDPAELAESWTGVLQVSWLRGPALDVGPWPEDARGRPLAHVATFSLTDVSGAWDGQFHSDSGDMLSPDVPSRWDGYLEIFHDLSCFGYDPRADRAERSFLVRRVPSTGARTLQDPPRWQPDPVTDLSPQLGLFWPAVSISRRRGIHLTAQEFEDLERAEGDLLAAWEKARFGRDWSGVTPLTRFGGVSSHGYRPVQRVLEAALPLQDGDEHVLLASVETATALEGWFSDSGDLEVWIRRSDLTAQRFEASWLLTRTD